MTTECIIPAIKPDARGYIPVHRGDRLFFLMHRLAWQSFYGPVPPGLQLHHTCYDKACCNPAHLMAVTPKEHAALHLADGRHGSAINAAKTHCPHGHEYTDANTYTDSRGKRNCRDCNRAAVARYTVRRKRVQP